MNFYDIFCERTRDYLDRPAVCQMMASGKLRTLSYQDLLDGINRYYEMLLATGDYKPGDRIGICGAASPEWHMAFFAIARLDCTAACIDHTYPSDEMQKIAHKAKLRGLYLTDNTNAVLNDPMDGVNLYRLEDGLQRQLAPRKDDSTISTEEASVLIFSSGTTSTAAGILHKAENAVASIEMILNLNHVDDDKQKFMAFLPNSHIYGCYAQCVAPMLHGNPVCYMEELSAACILGSFEAFHPTIFCGVPKVYELLMGNIRSKIDGSAITRTLFKMLFPVCLKLRKATGINLGALLFGAVKKGLGGGADVMLCGGAPLLRETAEFLYGVGLRPIVTYGATETSIPTLGNYGKNLTMDTCGKAYPPIDIRFSTEGELQLQSPYMMIGYFDEPERTAEAYTEDGWFKTGDLAALDALGNIVIQGRLKENIVLATGKKVAPDDIEANYFGMPGVADYTVCGVPAGDTGSYDEVHCFIVPEPGADPELIEQAFQDKSSESPLVMKLHGIHFIGDIPRTALGKPKRFKLVKAMQSGEPLAPLEVVKATDDVPVEEKVIYAVKKITGATSFDNSARLFHDLALDSLSAIELCVELEVLTGVRVDDYTGKDSTVQDLIDLCKNPPTPAEVKQKFSDFPIAHKAIDYAIMKIPFSVIRFLYKVKIRGEHNIPENSGYILCANHVSNFDYFFMACNFKKSRFNKLGCMAKKELFKDNVFGRLLVRLGGMVPVDRHGGSVSNSMNVLKSKLQDAWGIVLFPEGTRSFDGNLSEFKHGASSLAVGTGVPIIPAYIRGGFEAYPRQSALPKLFNFKTFHRYHVEVEYGDPIYPDGSSQEALTQRVREAIEKMKNSKN
ncbi:MAG: AMP-binding protein [Eubacterium sp.]|nr:AMP-binding protein [Candidatus Colimonas fimequi]